MAAGGVATEQSTTRRAGIIRGVRSVGIASAAVVSLIVAAASARALPEQRARDAQPATERQRASGLHGTALQGPITAVCSDNEPCEAPAPAVELVFTLSGRMIPTGRVRTQRDGTYRIQLPAGIYSVRTDRRVFGRIPVPAHVKVRRGHDDRLDFRIDTGIR
jgi:hypothetical protein